MTEPAAPTTPLSPSAALYGGLMAAACVAALAATVAAGLALGGGQRAAMLAAGAVGVGSMATFLPLLLSGVGAFGVRVLFASVVRMLVILCLAWMMDLAGIIDPASPARRAFWLAAFCGGAFILVAESVVAVSLLARIERQKSGGRSAPPSMTLRSVSPHAH